VTGGEGGDVFPPRRQPGAGVREDTRVVEQYEQLPEFPKSSRHSIAHPDVLQYRTGNYWANIPTNICILFSI